ncbi:bacteriochlorophyll 4-vinyl reductase [Pelagibius sp.]|uniref:bacteriochlorophyll 4-vinyl reductase n=1 Tax=Pelagibius sp. TaxID=1931238 RepID=UPI00260ADF4C|nr:bacteriochlorophyll 4-vinyl reductase [Pelagibius sp.]
MAEAILQADQLASRVGPNAVIQLAGALRDRSGQHAAEDLFRHAGLQHFLIDPPGEMVDEALAAKLFGCLFADLPAATAAAIAAEAGTRTADYILANRIPALAQRILRALPPALAGPLLLTAIAKNAWTFAGSGRLRTESARGKGGNDSHGPFWIIEIADNPLAMPGCVWHSAVFRRLFETLVRPAIAVRHPDCCHAGAPCCRFEIGVDARTDEQPQRRLR